ncbi:ABC transporter substrate-binding protein [Patescibacteria group bacterium]|nr:ABC transporter substrate-binding protein [Patescibacteria group bacterium]
MKKLLLFFGMISVMLLSACATQDVIEEAASELPDVIKIGYIGPLSGNAAAYGQDVKEGIELYFTQNPSIDGKTVEVIYEDGKCNGQDSANAAQKLITVDKVAVILGGQCSGETLAAAPIAEQNQVVMISSLSSSPDVTTAGDYIFRNYPSDMKVSGTLVDDLLDKDYKAIAILAEQTDYSQAFSHAIKVHLESREEGDRLVVQESYSVDNTDFRTLLAKVQEAEADVLISIAQTPVTNGFTVKQAAELGLDIQIYGTDTIDGVDFFDAAKDAAEGVKMVVVSEDPSRKGYNDFVANTEPAQASPVFPAFGYDSANLAANAIAAVGYDATAIKDWFYSMKKFKGIASDVSFDENGDNLVAASIKVAKNGKFVLINN